MHDWYDVRDSPSIPILEKNVVEILIFKNINLWQQVNINGTLIPVKRVI